MRRVGGSQPGHTAGGHEKTSRGNKVTRRLREIQQKIDRERLTPEEKARLEAEVSLYKESGLWISDATVKTLDGGMKLFDTAIWATLDAKLILAYKVFKAILQVFIDGYWRDQAIRE
jgi:hypothetical protein